MVLFLFWARAAVAEIPQMPTATVTIPSPVGPPIPPRPPVEPGATSRYNVVVLSRPNKPIPGLRIKIEKYDFDSYQYRDLFDLETPNPGEENFYAPATYGDLHRVKVNPLPEGYVLASVSFSGETNYSVRVVVHGPSDLPPFESKECDGFRSAATIQTPNGREEFGVGYEEKVCHRYDDPTTRQSILAPLYVGSTNQLVGYSNGEIVAWVYGYAAQVAFIGSTSGRVLTSRQRTSTSGTHGSEWTAAEVIEPQRAAGLRYENDRLRYFLGFFEICRLQTGDTTWVQTRCGP